jgi:hypothetical protein
MLLIGCRHWPSLALKLYQPRMATFRCWQDGLECLVSSRILGCGCKRVNSRSVILYAGGVELMMDELQRVRSETESPSAAELGCSI